MTEEPAATPQARPAPAVVEETVAAQPAAAVERTPLEPLGLRALRWALNLLDWPFQNLPLRVKKTFGIVAIVLLIPALTLLLLCLFFPPPPMQ